MTHIKYFFTGLGMFLVFSMIALVPIVVVLLLVKAFPVLNLVFECGFIAMMVVGTVLICWQLGRDIKIGKF